jgi:hypothetical protein
MYKSTKQNLVQQFAKYVANFIPQNGKKRNLAKYRRKV